MMVEDGDKRRWRPPAADSKSEGRGMRQNVRAKAKHSASSRAWLERQLNDPYVRRAKEEGWRARAAYKLIELDERFKLLKPRLRVLDLGAAPGGWSQVVAQRGATALVGVDLLAIDALPGATFLQADFLDPETAPRLLAALGGAPDLVLSDMAANTTGHQRTDQIRTGALAEAAAQFAMEVAAPGGTFVTKAFQGGLDSALVAELKRAFADVRNCKPPASRAESSEIYVVARGFRGGGRG